MAILTSDVLLFAVSLALPFLLLRVQSPLLWLMASFLAILAFLPVIVASYDYSQLFFVSVSITLVLTFFMFVSAHFAKGTSTFVGFSK